AGNAAETWPASSASSEAVSTHIWMIRRTAIKAMEASIAERLERRGSGVSGTSGLGLQVDSRRHQIRAAPFEHDLRQRSPGRALEHGARASGEEPLVAGAFELSAGGRVNDGAGKMRALLAIGHEGLGIEPEQQTGIVGARVAKEPQASDRDFLHARHGSLRE